MNFTFCYEIIPNFRYKVIPGKESEAKSILIWVMISLTAFDSLNYFFRKFASSSPPIRRKTNSVLTNIPLNVIPIMLESFFMGIYSYTKSGDYQH